MDITKFAQNHVPQITATVGMVTYSLVRKKLTTGGILAGILVAGTHMIHPWPAFFWLLILFFFLGTLVTKVGHQAKARLTQSSTGGTGGEGARTSAQVFANTGTACIFIGLHAYLLHNSTPFLASRLGIFPGPYFPMIQRLLPIGIIAQYAAVAADTFSSELGILAHADPFMITAPWRRVRKGTNGGVTVAGLLYGALGGFLLVSVAMVALYGLPPRIMMDVRTAALLVVAGFAGSLIDSVLGALVQVTVTDKGTGRVVEGPGGKRVRVAQNGSRLQQGRDLLTNNGVNFAMAFVTSLATMAAAWVLELGLDSR